MNNKPFTYDSLKTIILYTEPNLRFLLSSRVPSIRATERVVPLKIKELVIGSHYIEVNKTRYEIDLYQISSDELPYQISGVSGLSRRRTCDVDEFGTRDYITRAGGMLPGNDGTAERNLFGDRDPNNIPTNYGRVRRLRRRVNVEKQRLDQLLVHQQKVGSVPKPLSGGLIRFKTIDHNVAQVYNEMELGFLDNKEMVEEAIKDTENKI
uniref:Plus3 domain-containing protein n=1 Tax=Caenorhabditis tropicalis TaxID=1561998 RepID=A0A1I7UDU0_9PELO